MEIKKILVATDFTSVADNAISHAVKLASASDAEIFLLHVVKSNEEVEKAKDKISKQIAKYPGSKILRLVRIGNFINEIGDAAAEVQAQLIVMGTHGPKGFMQSVTGGDAMKVVTHSTKPFIVVQEKGIGENGYDSIVVPLDMSNDSKQKLDEVADIAKYFQSKVHIFVKNEKDASLKGKLKNNILFAKKYYIKKGIPLVITISKSSKSFDTELLEFSEAINADLIAIVNTLKWNMFGGLLSARREQDIITNEKQIPVLCVNPIDVTSGYTM
jgi:nucleotide-binding universal stress UspA family protein